jgi:aminodeoxyfutalosine synthase
MSTNALDHPPAPPMLSEVESQYMASHDLAPLMAKVQAGQRLTRDEAIAIYHHPDLLAIGMMADVARRRIVPPEHLDTVWWVHNYHINPTNICEDTCHFCSFKKGPSSPHAYFWTINKIVADIKAYEGFETLHEFHIVAGHYEKATTAYYAQLFRTLRQEFPWVNIKGLTAAELHYMAKIDGLSIETVLSTLIEAGLQALPGGGAEIFAPRVREAVCPGKITGEEWLAIHGMAHGMGLKSNATMLAGLGETPEERIDHILAIRDQQDKSGGFLSFIPLNCYYDNNKIDAKHALSGVDNLKNFAIARLLLDNVPHIKAFWIHIGEKISQVGLYYGVDDIDGTVVQEKIAHSAGTQTAQGLTKRQLVHLIRQAGRVPMERDAFYNVVKVLEPVS